MSIADPGFEPFDLNYALGHLREWHIEVPANLIRELYADARGLIDPVVEHFAHGRRKVVARDFVAMR